MHVQQQSLAKFPHISRRTPASSDMESVETAKLCKRPQPSRWKLAPNLRDTGLWLILKVFRFEDLSKRMKKIILNQRHLASCNVAYFNQAFGIPHREAVSVRLSEIGREARPRLCI